ncbi:MAG TPA: ion channel, partial [Longimicrobium sp.]|nr:ion channel [Longimicrobium sp.]
MPPRRRRKAHPTLLGGRHSLGHRLRASLEDPLRQFQLSVAVLLLLIVVGTVGYHAIEEMGWVDSLYMTIITVATVGFGEIEPLSRTGRIFTMGLIVVGVGIGAWAVTNMVEVALGQTLWTSVQRHKMKQSLTDLRDHYVVCGHGRLGMRIVRDLAARGESFVVVDVDPRLEETFLAHQLPHVI